MSLSTTENRVQFLGNGSTTAFTFPYRFIETGHVFVTLTNVTTGLNTPKSLGIDYSLVGANSPSGGTVTFFTPPTANERVTIERVVPITQEIDYQPDDDFPSEVHESALDKLTMIDQQVSAKLGRTLNAPATDTVSLNALPNAAARANRTLVFDATGQPAASLDNYTDNATNAAASASAAAASASAAAGFAQDAEDAYDNFQGKFIGGFPVDPIVDSNGNPVTSGALYFNTSLNEIRVYNGTVWTALAPSTNFTARRFTYFATGPAQTSVSGVDQNGFTLEYDPPHVDVFVNGVKLPSGYLAATNGTSILFNAAVKLTLGDWIEVVAYTVATVIGVGDGAITQPKLATNSVSTIKIQDLAVTPDKLATTGISAGAYTTPNISVNTKGQITAITSSVQLSTTASKLVTVDTGECGYYHAERTSFFVDSNGFLRTAGEAYYQKGLGENALDSASGGWQTVFMPFTQSGEAIDKVYCGPRQVYVLSTAGLLYTAGYNNEGCSGTNVATDVAVKAFTNISTFTTADPVTFFSVDRGLSYGNHCAAVTQSGKLYTWGYNGYGQLGIPGDTNRRLVPTLINSAAIAGKTLKKCFALGGGAGRTFVTDTDDNVYCCGYNGYGQLGLGDTTNRTNGFVQVTSINGSKADRIFGTCSRSDYPNSSTWVLRNGQLFACGSNTNSVLGVGDSVNKSSFVAVINLAGKTVTDFAVGSPWSDGGASACVLCSDGTLVNWGYDGTGALGRGSGAGTADKAPGVPLSTSQNSITTFTKIQFFGHKGQTTFAALGTDKKVYCCGWVGSGAIGNGTLGSDVQRLEFARIPETIADFSYGSGESGYNHIMARAESGRLWVWGWNRVFVLGVPGQSNVAYPLPMPSLIGF